MKTESLFCKACVMAHRCGPDVAPEDCGALGKVKELIRAIEPMRQEELSKPIVLSHEEFRDLFQGDGNLPGLGFHSC